MDKAGNTYLVERGRKVIGSRGRAFVWSGREQEVSDLQQTVGGQCMDVE